MFKYNFINIVKKKILINIRRAFFSFNLNEPLLLKFCYFIYLLFGYKKITLFFLKLSFKKISSLIIKKKFFLIQKRKHQVFQLKKVTRRGLCRENLRLILMI